MQPSRNLSLLPQKEDFLLCSVTLDSIPSHPLRVVFARVPPAARESRPSTSHFSSACIPLLLCYWPKQVTQAVPEPLWEETTLEHRHREANCCGCFVLFCLQTIYYLYPPYHLRCHDEEIHMSLSLVWQFSSVTQSSPTLRPHGPKHTRPPCPSPTPGVHSNSCPSSR